MRRWLQQFGRHQYRGSWHCGGGFFNDCVPHDDGYAIDDDRVVDTTIPETTTVPPVTVTTTTSLPHDDEPPEAPTGLVCLGMGGGSMEVLLAFDAPSDPTDIETIRVYVDEGSGFQRVAKTTIDGSPASLGSVFDLNTTDPTTWSMGVFPVPDGAEIGIAVTFGDAAGNESGWYPITVTPTGISCS